MGTTTRVIARLGYILAFLILSESTLTLALDATESLQKELTQIIKSPMGKSCLFSLESPKAIENLKRNASFLELAISCGEYTKNMGTLSWILKNANPLPEIQKKRIEKSILALLPHLDIEHSSMAGFLYAENLVKEVPDFLPQLMQLIENRGCVFCLIQIWNHFEQTFKSERPMRLKFKSTWRATINSFEKNPSPVGFPASYSNIYKIHKDWPELTLPSFKVILEILAKSGYLESIIESRNLCESTPQLSVPISRWRELYLIAIQGSAEFDRVDEFCTGINSDTLNSLPEDLAIIYQESFKKTFQFWGSQGKLKVLSDFALDDFCLLNAEKQYNNRTIIQDALVSAIQNTTEADRLETIRLFLKEGQPLRDGGEGYNPRLFFVNYPNVLRAIYKTRYSKGLKAEIDQLLIDNQNLKTILIPKN